MQNTQTANSDGNRSVDQYLLLVSFIYLGLPNLLFAVGWLKPLYALIYTGVCLAGLIFLVARIRIYNISKAMEKSDPEWNPRFFALICLILAIWVSFSGIGEVGYQNDDWKAHNSLLKHLVEEDWPLILKPKDPQQDLFFYVYYVAYYLPAALIGKLLGWTATNIALFLWSVAGVIIAVSWFLRILDLQKRPGASLFVVLVFALFGGWDIVGWYLRHEELPEIGEHLEWWAKHFQYSAHTTLLVWVPQHTIAAWILTGVAMFHSVFKFPPHSFGLFVAFSLLWTPFAIIGVLPFVVLALVLWIRENTFEGIFSISNLVLTPIVGFTSALFLVANSFSFPISLGWVGRPDFLLFYVVFLILELIVFLVPLYWLARDWEPARAYRPWLWTSVGVLLLLPLFRMGFANDFVMRASIPSLFVLLIFVAYGLFREASGAKTIAQTVLIIVFCVGTLSGISELARSVQNYGFPPPDTGSVQNFLDLNENHVAQRRGDPNALFFRHLARD